MKCDCRFRNGVWVHACERHTEALARHDEHLCRETVRQTMLQAFSVMRDLKDLAASPAGIRAIGAVVETYVKSIPVDGGERR